MQQGGSSADWSGSLYDSKKDAEAGIQEIQDASYDACGPYKLGEALTRAMLSTPCAEGELIELLDEITVDAVAQNFNR